MAALDVRAYPLPPQDVGQPHFRPNSLRLILGWRNGPFRTRGVQVAGEDGNVPAVEQQVEADKDRDG